MSVKHTYQKHHYRLWAPYETERRMWLLWTDDQRELPLITLFLPLKDLFKYVPEALIPVIFKMIEE